jgi:hypothetical protein
VYQGRTAMRVSIVGWRTTVDDIEAAVAAVLRALDAARGAGPGGG